MIAGVILAGGLSRRMGGGDKGLRDLGGQSLLDHVIARLAPQVDRLVLNANGPADRFSAYHLPVVADSVPDYAGPLAGILAGLDWARAEGASRLVSVAADTPFFPTDLVARLGSAVGDTRLVAMAATQEPERGLSRHPTFALWPVELADPLRAALASGTRKVIAFSDAHGCETVEFGTGAYDPFFNVNTPLDMAQAHRLLDQVE